MKRRTRLDFITEQHVGAPIPSAYPVDLAITIILDRSGSMEQHRGSVVEGFNTFINKRKQEYNITKPIIVNLLTFSYSPTWLYLGKPLPEVPALTLESYVAGGGTALLDAMYTGIGSHAPANKNLILTITDGEENSSVSTTRLQLFDLISQKRAANWDFVFLGANQDAIKVAEHYGIRRGSTMSFDTNARALKNVWVSTANYVGGTSLASNAEEAVKVSYTDRDRSAAVVTDSTSKVV